MICPICFKDLDREPHSPWCPNRTPDLEEMFGGIFSEENED